MLSRQMSGEAILTVAAYSSFLLAGMSCDLVSGPCFFLSPYVPWCSEELGSDLMSMLRAWGYKACGNTLFHSLFIFLFLTLKPAGLLNSARFFQREKALLYFFMGTS